jgi:hypothetical protein
MAKYNKKTQAEHVKKIKETHLKQQVEKKKHKDKAKEDYDKEYGHWKSEHDKWKKDYGDWIKLDPETPNYEYMEPVEPLEPEPLPESDEAGFSVEDLIEYEAHTVEALEEVETLTGKILVTPGRHIMRGSDGSVFAISEEELTIGFQEVEGG